MKDRKSLKRIVSLLLIIFQVRISGSIGNLVNLNGVKNYHELVENFTEFLNEQGINDPQHIYEYFNYAMWNGYLSKDKNLQYSVDRKVYMSNPGMSIASGDAVCLNYADMLSHIFREFGYNSYMAMCYVDSDNAHIEKIRTDKDIERKINPGDSERIDVLFGNYLLDGITKVFGNHAITCVEDNGEIYIFDPTNLAYLDKSGFNNVDIVNGSGKFDLRYLTSMLFDNINIFKVIPSTNNDNYKLEVINKDELVFDNEALDKFHEENKDIINEIDKVNKRGTNSGMLEILIYGLLSSLILSVLKKVLSKVAIKCKFKDVEDIKEISNNLKEYLNEHEIETPYEILKNFKLINKELGIKNSYIKDLSRRTIITINDLVNYNSFYDNILVCLLDYLGIEASVCYTKKYHNGIPLGDKVIVKYKYNDKYYYFDPEIDELLYEIDKILYSKNKRYKYKRHNKYFNYDTLKSKEEVEKVMNEEDTLLKKEDIKELKKSKILRRNEIN